MPVPLSPTVVNHIIGINGSQGNLGCNPIIGCIEHIDPIINGNQAGIFTTHAFTFMFRYKDGLGQPFIDTQAVPAERQAQARNTIFPHSPVDNVNLAVQPDGTAVEHIFAFPAVFFNRGQQRIIW